MRTAAVLVAALVVVAGVLVAVLTVGRAAPRDAGGARVAGLGDERVDLTAELDRLRTSVDALAARVERLEVARPSPVAPLAAGGSSRSAIDTVTAADLEALRDELAALKSSARGAAGGSAFEQQVLGVLEAQERREEEERAAARREAALTRIEERVAELAGELGLSSFQSGEMLSILTDEDERREAFFGQLREGGGFDRSAIRNGMEELRDTTLAAVKGVLSGEQYERYLESSGGGFFGSGSGRGSRGDEGDRERGGR
jgi:hypothetical protein